MTNEIIVDDEIIQRIVTSESANIHDLEYAFKRAYIGELIRCKDCKYCDLNVPFEFSENVVKHLNLCRETDWTVDKYDYCSKAERKEQ